jgi:hypothetical protein
MNLEHIGPWGGRRGGWAGGRACASLGASLTPLVSVLSRMMSRSRVERGLRGGWAVLVPLAVREPCRRRRPAGVACPWW